VGRASLFGNAKKEEENCQRCELRRLLPTATLESISPHTVSSSHTHAHRSNWTSCNRPCCPRASSRRKHRRTTDGQPKVLAAAAPPYAQTANIRYVATSWEAAEPIDLLLRVLGPAMVLFFRPPHRRRPVPVRGRVLRAGSFEAA